MINDKKTDKYNGIYFIPSPIHIKIEKPQIKVKFIQGYSYSEHPKYIIKTPMELWANNFNIKDITI